MNNGRDKETFEQRLAAAQAAAKGRTKRDPAQSGAGAASQAVNFAMRLGVELVAAMVIAVGIGWGLDRLFHTKPWLMLVMVPVGMAAGLRNLVRAAGKTDGGRDKK
ncbi:AtpZ/AtpI family protein [Acidocella sp.]|uniref:AtpZ/AtpI family protein n=1 Tax=Acidocella sp. TaxID=50710 RepID=UPI0017AF5FBB|nr:AtpZ/AtpI family protein [Acidocella sp.]MDD2795083.1 AtpZ/AtpI family protein [Acidocella sp.]NNM55908.1 AtpZ/AtpI family protein [Acidocella sp.]